MTKVKDVTYENLIEKVKTYITDKKKLDLIEKAYKTASEKHEGQF